MVEVIGEHPELRQALIPLPPDVVAVVLINEGWMMKQGGVSEEEAARRMQVAKDQKIHTDPDRVEVKIVSAVDLNGVRYGYQRARDTTALDPKLSAIVGRWEPLGQRSGAVLGGAIVTSLQYLMETLQERTLPPWSEYIKVNDHDPDEPLPRSS